jgi:hypothetical protein
MSAKGIIMAAAGVVVASGPSAPPGSQTFYYTGSTQNFTVPNGKSTLSVKIWGAGGGSNRDAGAGGGGGYTGGNLSVNSGEVLTIYVGRGGLGGGDSTNETTSLDSAATRLNGGTGGWPGGGTGGSPGSYGAGGGGGGYSGIFRSSTPLAIAGGGGGGGDDGGASAGGGSTAGGPYGGTQTAGGSNGTTPSNASYYAGYLQGASGIGTGSGAGGGGGGYYGGGLGPFWGGGGGGSGYVTGSLTTTGGTTVTPGNSTDADRGVYGNGAPAGGTGENSASTRLGLKGRDGIVIISWT